MIVKQSNIDCYSTRCFVFIYIFVFNKVIKIREFDVCNLRWKVLIYKTLKDILNWKLKIIIQRGTVLPKSERKKKRIRQINRIFNNQPSFTRTNFNLNELSIHPHSSAMSFTSWKLWPNNLSASWSFKFEVLSTNHSFRDITGRS